MATISIAQAEADLVKAREAYDSAEAANRRASSAKTDATNQLNRAQKAFDDAVALVRKNPPYGTDWSFEAKKTQG